MSSGLFKAQGGQRRSWSQAKQGCLGRPQAPPCTWFDLSGSRKQLPLQTENYLKLLPAVVSELHFYNSLTGWQPASCRSSACPSGFSTQAGLPPAGPQSASLQEGLSLPGVAAWS